MPVIIACAGMLLIGLVAVGAWSSQEIEAPPPSDAETPVRTIVQRYFWWVLLIFYTSLASGLLIVGPAARLAMRILAATAGAAAQGRETEAEEIVGRITVGGTIGLLVFVGVFFGLASTVGYFAARRWLPCGAGGGLIYGGILLAVVATRVDPLRSDNSDFDIVGPGWLSVVIYVAMALLQGVAIAAFAGRLSRALPLFSNRPGALAAYAPLLITLPLWFLAIVIAVGLLAVLAVHRISPMLNALRSNRVIVAGRLALAVVVVVSLPTTIPAIASIASRP